MNIFALDSASKTASVAIVRNDVLVYEAYLCNGLTHSETLMTLAENAFSVTGLQAKDIHLFAVNAGPGSFTGLRIGMALIKGMAMPFNTPCAGVSTLESMAHTFCGEGRLICALNARRNQVYFAAFDIENGNVTRLCEDIAADAETVRQYAVQEMNIMGDGADVIQNVLGSEFALKLYSAHFANGRANGIAACAKKQKPCTVQELEINYHRLSQAQRLKAEKENFNE